MTASTQALAQSPLTWRQRWACRFDQRPGLLLRLAMYSAFIVLAVAVAWQRSQTNDPQALRAADNLLWLLAVLAVAVVEPGVRCVQRHIQRHIQRNLQGQAKQALKHPAPTDSPTPLLKRSAFMQRLQEALAHAAQDAAQDTAQDAGYGFVLLALDFDRFKQSNDSPGTAAGDELLRQVAQRLEGALRPGDALAWLTEQANGSAGGLASDEAARLSGEEFVLLLEGVHETPVATAIAQRLLKLLSAPYLLDQTQVQSSVSMGLVVHRAGTTPALMPIPKPMPSAEDLLRNAGTALLQAQRAGRGRWVLFDNAMHERLVGALALEADLRRALKSDELFVVYQPVVDLASLAVTAVEALVRWRHPQRGLVAPSEFMAAAAEAGLIDEVASLLLRKACQQFVRWRASLREHAPPLLAVNLSRAQLKQPGMVQDLDTLLRQCGMQPECLQLEVTESLAAQDLPVQATLRLLKQLGVKLALDDFGTGYSSLACLHQLPVDTVKVDRSFVQHAQTVEYHRVLIEATIRVARTLGMTTVADGIETEGQASLLRELQCDRGQGDLFSQPLEAAALEAWVRREVAVSA